MTRPGKGGRQGGGVGWDLRGGQGGLFGGGNTGAEPQRWSRNQPCLNLRGERSWQGEQQAQRP